MRSKLCQMYNLERIRRYSRYCLGSLWLWIYLLLVPVASYPVFIVLNKSSIRRFSSTEVSKFAIIVGHIAAVI